MKTHFRSFLIAWIRACWILAIFAVSPVAEASFSRGGGLGVGTRAMGMGGAYVALADDPSASYWNPAGAVQMREGRVAGMFGTLFNDKSRNPWLAVHYPTRDDLHFTVSYAGLFFTETGGTREDTYTASFAAPLTKDRRWMGGASFRYHYADYGASGGIARGRGVDVGLLYLWPLSKNRQLALGLAATDLFTTVRFASGIEHDLPLMVTPGLAFKFNPNTLAEVDFSWADTRFISDEDRFRVRGGVEHWLFDHRWGVRAGYEKFTTMPGQMSLGTSYNASKWSLEYAYGNHPQQLGNSHRFGATWKFPASGSLSPVSTTPFNIKSLVGDEKIYLGWDVPPGVKVDGYWVYYRSEGEKEYHRRRPEYLETNYCVLRGAQNGVAYHIYVRLIVNGRQGSPSTEITAIPRPLLEEAKMFFDRGVEYLNRREIEPGLAAARQAEQLDAANYDIKELIRRLQNARKEGLLK